MLDVTFNDVLSVFPFNNQVVLAEVKGQALRDFLELAVKYWPTESGAFPHLSGITFSVNTAIESAAVVDENWVFTGINGQYRVYNIKVLNRESGGYEPLDLNKTYSIASDSYHLLECGDGMSMFENAKILQNDGMCSAYGCQSALPDLHPMEHQPQDCIFQPRLCSVCICLCNSGVLYQVIG